MSADGEAHSSDCAATGAPLRDHCLSPRGRKRTSAVTQAGTAAPGARPLSGDQGALTWRSALLPEWALTATQQLTQPPLHISAQIISQEGER